MFVTDLKRDFFDLLLSDERVLVIANIDVDSICAVKILQTLLQCEHVSYTLLPITGKSDLIKVFEENVSSGKFLNIYS
jgi:cell division control protein 45